MVCTIIGDLLDVSNPKASIGQISQTKDTDYTTRIIMYNLKFTFFKI